MRQPTRREMLQATSLGISGLVLPATASGTSGSRDLTLGARAGHMPARASRVIFLFLNGGLSHVDTFDYKPRLIRDAWKTVRFHEWQGQAGEGSFFLKPPGWRFRPGGESGLLVSDLFPHLRASADELCVINSLCSDHTNHYEASLGMHTGSFTFSRPSMGVWVSFGLGSENVHLPTFVVLSPGLPYAGTQAFASDFLPGTHQGTHIVPGATPVANLDPRRDMRLQRREIDFVRRLNERHGSGRPERPQLAARSTVLDVAIGMQTAAPEAFDLSGETRGTLSMYGLEPGQSDGFGWQCLVARRLAERGVRFIEVISSNWDHHGDMANHEGLARSVDQPAAALIRDLRLRGLLDETLVVLCSEFGRTPHHKEKDHKGREHHHQVFTTVLAGGGLKRGHVHGQSDEYGIEPAEKRVHLHDFHATLLHLLGLDHERLTYRHAGRDYRLTDVHGTVIDDIIA